MHNVFTRANIAELKEGRTDFRNTYIKADIDLGSGRGDITGADFSGATFANIKMRHTVFKECDFSNAVIRADIENVAFVDCNFENARFEDAQIYESEMRGNHFHQTQFIGTLVHQTDISGNDFLNAEMDMVKMGGIVVKKPNIHLDTVTYKNQYFKVNLERMQEESLKEPSASSGYGNGDVTEEGLITDNDGFIRKFEERIQKILTIYKDSSDIQRQDLSELRITNDGMRSMGLYDASTHEAISHAISKSFEQVLKQQDDLQESPYDAAIEEALAAAEMEAVDMGMEM